MQPDFQASNCPDVVIIGTIAHSQDREWHPTALSTNRQLCTDTEKRMLLSSKTALFPCSQATHLGLADQQGAVQGCKEARLPALKVGLNVLVVVTLAHAHNGGGSQACQRLMHLVAHRAEVLVLPVAQREYSVAGALQAVQEGWVTPCAGSGERKLKSFSQAGSCSAIAGL